MPGPPPLASPPPAPAPAPPVIPSPFDAPPPVPHPSPAAGPGPVEGTGDVEVEGPLQYNPQDYYKEQQVDTRPCRACGGELHFDPGTQGLACPHCGATEAIVNDPSVLVEEQSLAALRRAGGERHLTHLEDEKEIVCQNCGGHTTFVGTMTSTRCPYCATPIQRTDVHEAPDRLAVDGVLPFAVTEDVATENLQKWIKGRWFAPGAFKRYSTQGSFESVYSAYFTYDADCLTQYRGRRGDHYTRTIREGDQERTVTETRWWPASGTVHNVFDDIVVAANTGFERKYIDALEPWPTQSLQPFNRDYLAGHLSRTYDRDVEDCLTEARQRMESDIDHTVRRDIGGDVQEIHHKDTRYRSVTYKHVLLPIWLLTVLYEGRALQVYMNGVTGEIHGQRPWSRLKIAAAVVAAIVAIVAIVVLVSLAGG